MSGSHGSDHHAQMARANVLGAVFMVIGQFGFVVNDSLMKQVLVSVPLMQAIFIRGLITMGLLLVVARLSGSLTGFRGHFHWLLLVRALCEAGAAFLYLTAITQLPIATATALLMAMPLFVTLAASFFLGEKVGWHRYSAIAVGFVGVMIVLQPVGDDFNAYSLLVLATVACMVVRDLSTKRLPKTIPAIFVTGTSTFGVVLAAGMFLVPIGWQPMAGQDWPFLIAAAGLLFIGYHFSVLAIRTGDISISAPFRYTSLVWGVVMGFALFGEIPGVAMLTGSAIIILAGAYSLMREKRALSPKLK